MDATTGTTRSADGTEIAWTRQGAGPDLVMVHCVGVSRATTPQPTLPHALAAHFTVWSYDRRGKGRSGNTPPYAVEREFDDLAAVIALAEGSPVTVYGFSSGATLALLAADAGVPMARLALLEPPLSPEPDPEHELAREAQRRVDEDLASAHRWFDTEIVGVPPEVLDQLPPLTEEDLDNTRTIVHELTFLPGTPAGRFAGVRQPVLVVTSDHTAPVMHEFASALKAALPRATHRVLPGEWHGVDDTRLTDAIVEFAAA